MAVYTINSNAQANEGYVQSSSATVANARNGTGTIAAKVGLSPSDPPAVMFGITGGTYFDFLGFIEFDTSSLAGKSILSATLTLPSAGSFGSDTFSQQLQARLYDYGSSLGTANWRDPTQFSACTLLAHYDNFIPNMATPGSYDLVSDALAANINKSGMTRMVLGTSLHASAGTPSAYSGMQFSAEHPNEPYLTVTTSGFSGLDTRSRRVYLRR